MEAGLVECESRGIARGEKRQFGASEANENRHIGGYLRRNWVEGILQERDSVNDRRESRDHPGDEASKFAIDSTLRGHDAVERQGLNVRDATRS